jgi:hypothetical protein
MNAFSISAAIRHIHPLHSERAPTARGKITQTLYRAQLGLALFIMAMFACGHMAAAGGTNTFTPTGPLATARGIATATLLSTGKVLIAAGQDTNGNILASTELYDPASGTFGATGDLQQARAYATATLLMTGQALIVGGRDANIRSVYSWELYNPTTGMFTVYGYLAAARYLHTATLLANGKVLVAGGYDSYLVGSAQPHLSTAEVFDPVSSSFSATGNMTTAREVAMATLLPNGKVLIAGGFDINGSALASAELYDPAAGTFAATGSMATARGVATATLLPSGRVLVAAGFTASGISGGNPIASAELYNPATGTFAPTGNLATARWSATATLLPSGHVLIAAGNGNVTNVPPPLASAELYDPAVGTFAATGSLSTGRWYDTETLLSNGNVLVAGGYDAAGAALASAEIYNSSDRIFANGFESP